MRWLFPAAEDRGRAGERGTSTLEALVAITALALMTLGMQGLLSSSIRTSQAAIAQSERREAIDTARRVIEGLLARAAPEPIEGTLGRHIVQFQGGPRSLLALSELPVHVGGGGRHVVMLSVPADKPGMLVLQWRPELSILGADDPRAWRELVLLRGVDSVRFRYFSSAIHGGGWTEAWRARPTLPTLVRIDVAFAEGSGVAWSPLVVAIRSDAPGLCVIDPLTSRCRIS